MNIFCISFWCIICNKQGRTLLTHWSVHKDISEIMQLSGGWLTILTLRATLSLLVNGVDARWGGTIRHKAPGNAIVLTRALLTLRGLSNIWDSRQSENSDGTPPPELQHPFLFALQLVYNDWSPANITMKGLLLYSWYDNLGTCNT